MRNLRVHGGPTEYLHHEIGINSRLDALQAVILGVKLDHLDTWSEARRQKAALYSELLTEQVFRTIFRYRLSLQAIVTSITSM
jgi:dTDP-4-amino-4,6-dideoxygalactose transaminase